MRAIDLITEEIPPLVHTDTGEKAINWMDEFKVSHLPVLKNGNFVGVVSESDILDRLDESQTLDALFDHLPRPFVYEHVHIYEVLYRMSEFKLSVIPILNDQEQYLGCTSVHVLINSLASTGGIKEPGGIIVLEMNKIDYSLAKIAQIVESENAKILSSYIFSSSDTTKIEITLKINQTDLSRIIRSFERYEMEIKATFQKGMHEDDMQWRFDALMNYLKF
jgi:CBS domain-containing protein